MKRPQDAPRRAFCLSTKFSSWITMTSFQSNKRTNVRKPLWDPSEERKKNAHLTRFIELANKKHGLGVKSYSDLYRWSVEDIPSFWATMWEFADIKSSRAYDAVVDDLRRFPGAKW